LKEGNSEGQRRKKTSSERGKPASKVPRWSQGGNGFKHRKIKKSKKKGGEKNREKGVEKKKK